MEEITRRPLFVFCVSFLALSLCFSGAPAAVKTAAAAVCALSALILFIISKRRKARSSLRRILLAVFLSAVLASLLSLVSFNVILGRAESLDSKEITGEAVIEDASYSSESFGVFRATLFPDGESVKKVRVSMTLGDGTLVPGDRIRGTFRTFRLEDGDGFSERSSLLPDGVMLGCEGGEFTFEGHENKVTPRSVIRNIRETLSARFSVDLDRDAAGLSSAVLLGDRSGLDPSLSRDFSRTGVYHLLAISGMHLSVLLFALEAALLRGGVRRGARGALSILFTLFFAALTGFSASVVRAGIMHIIRVSASFFRRDGDPLTSLGAAGALIVIFDPFAVLDPGLWLSILASYACVTSPGLRKKKEGGGVAKRALRKISGTIVTTVYVTVCTLPVIWLVFGSASVLSPLTNLVFIPAMTLYLILSLVCSAMSSLGIMITPLAGVIGLFYRLIKGAASFLAGGRYVVFPVRGAVPGIIIAALFVAAVALPLTGEKARRGAIRVCASSLACLILSVGTGALFRAKVPVGVYVNFGKNDGFAFREAGRYVLVDVSDGSWAFARRLINAAEDEGATETEALALTHYHKKHVATVYRMLSRTLVRRVFLPEPRNEEEEGILASVSDVCAGCGVPVTVIPANGPADLSKNVSVTLFERILLSRSSHPVVTFKVTTEGRDTLYLGSSFNETIAGEASFNADRIVFGAHPPKYGKTFVLGDAGSEVVMSREAAKYATPPDSAILPHGDKNGVILYRFTP